jgi:outer membrane protein assembly factor BamB
MNDITRREFLKRAGQTTAAAAVTTGLGAGLTSLAAPGSKAMPEAHTTPPGDWPMFRGDTRLTGRAALPGEMREPPTVAWQYKIEAGEVWAVVDPATAAGGSTSAAGVSDAYLKSAEGKRWGVGPKLVDLAGDGRLVPDPGRAAKLLPDVPGLQTIAFEAAPDGKSLDPKQAVCYAYDGGRKREVWRSEVYDTIQNTNFAIADIDNDGKLEVILAPHYRVIVYDGQTGRTKHLLRIHNFRNYGFACCTDVTGDGLLDVVIIADFAMHMDVVKNEGDHLRLLWRRDIEDNIQSKHRIVRPGPNPVFDLNGDGRSEILYNLFNDTGDGRWHVMAYDALTGETVLDLPERYLNGAADVNGDGVPELFVARADGLYVPNSSELTLLRVKGRDATPLWQHPRGRWVTEPVTLPLTHTTIVAHGTDDVMTAALGERGSEGVRERGSERKPPQASTLDPRPSTLRNGFFVLEPRKDGTEQCLAFAMGGNGKVAERWHVELPARSWMRVRACADVDGDGVDEALITFRQPERDAGHVGPASGAAARIVALDATTVPNERIGPGESRPLVVGTFSPSEGPTILFEGANNDIVALAPPAKGQGAGVGQAVSLPTGSNRQANSLPHPLLRWRIPGVGAVVLADVNGDGAPEVVFADWAESGEGVIVAADGRGKALWRHRVSGFPGPRPPWNFGGITSWWVGHYTAKGHCDVWASARRSTMHSDEAWMLRGTDGAELWHLREVRTDKTPPQGRGWGAGGSFVCSADVDGSGLEDVVSLYPVNYMAAQGSTGKLLHSVETASGVFEGVWAAYCQPIVADFNADGKEEILWCGPYHHGLTTLDAQVLWYHKGGASVAGVGDVDGDGKLELGFTGWESGKGLRCLDAATGTQKWEWPMEGNPRVPVYTADIDGDGRDEFLFANAQTLYAVGSRDGSAHLVWKTDLPAVPGNLALADVDRDGKTEILFIGADSTLYCLDKA